MSPKNKKEVGNDFMPDEPKQLEQVTPNELLKAMGSNATIPDDETISPFEAKQPETLQDEDFAEEIIESTKEVEGETVEAETVEQPPQRTILEEEQIINEACKLIESGELTPISTIPFDGGTIENYAYEGIEFKVDKVFRNEKFEIENLKVLRPQADEDEEFMDEIDEVKIKQPKSPEEAKKLIKKKQSEIEQLLKQQEDIKDIADLQTHAGLKNLLKRNAASLHSSIDDEDPKDLNDGRKPWEHVLGVIKQVGIIATNHRGIDSSIKTLEKEIEQLKEAGFQQELPLEVVNEEPQAESVEIEAKPLITGEDVDKYVEQIQKMLDSGDYEFAEETLEGILEWVEENDHITEEQVQAVENIAKSVKA